jgi:hypothetical protein
MSDVRVRSERSKGIRPLRKLRPCTESLEPRALLAASITHAKGVSISAGENKSFSDEVASFDAKGAKPSDFSVSISWGDGETSVGSVVKSGSGFKVVGKHKYDDAPSGLIIGTTIVDNLNDTTTQLSSTAKINGALIQIVPTPVNAVEATPLNGLIVARFRVLSKKVQSAGSLEANVIFAVPVEEGDNLDGHVQPDPTYKGVYDVTVNTHGFVDTTFPQGQPTTVQITMPSEKGSGGTAQIVSNTIVTPPPFSPISVSYFHGSNANDFLDEAHDDTGRFLGTIGFTDPAGILNDPKFVAHTSGYLVTINWGDGTKPVSYSDDGLSSITLFTVTTAPTASAPFAAAVSMNVPAHDYQNPGVYPVTITVLHVNPIAGKPPVTETFKTTESVLLVSPTTYQVTAYEATSVLNGGFATNAPDGSNALVSFPVTNTSDPSAQLSTYTATVAWGDQGPVDPPDDTAASLVLSKDGKSIEVIAGHDYSLAGTYTLILDIDDKATGDLVSETIEQITVTPQALTYDVNNEDDSVGPSGELSGDLATFMAGPNVPARDFSATINWGDSSTSNPATITEIGAGQFELSGSHSYPTEGELPYYTWDGTIVVTEIYDGPTQQVTIPFTVTLEPDSDS